MNKENINKNDIKSNGVSSLYIVNENINIKQIIADLENFYSSELGEDRKIEYMKFDYENSSDTLELKFKWKGIDEPVEESWEDFSQDNLSRYKLKEKDIIPLGKKQYLDMIIKGEVPIGCFKCENCGELTAPNAHNGYIVCDHCKHNLKPQIKDWINTLKELREDF